MKALLQFNDLAFEDKGETVRAWFLKSFYMDMERVDLENIAPFEIVDGAISFDGVDESRARGRFNVLLDKYFSTLMNKYTRKPAIYVHKGSGIPLLGGQSFGLIDRNSSIIEVRPVTGCNLNCVYCSVDEGLSTRKKLDFVVEKDYLVEEFKKLVEFKECNHIEAHIGTQGDPTLYGSLVELVSDLSAIPQVKEIAMDTNGMLLTEEIVDQLAFAGMTRINLSVNAFDFKLAKRIAGYGGYDLEHAMKIAAYAATKMDLLIAPVLVPGLNEEQMRPLVLFAKSIGARIGIQNFLNYAHGRNVAKQMAWEKFFDLLKTLQEETGVKLMLSKEDFHITATKKLPKPFKKNQTIDVEIKCPGRLPGQQIGVAGERAIVVHGSKKERGHVRVKLTRSKHNIFIGAAI